MKTQEYLIKGPLQFAHFVPELFLQVAEVVQSSLQVLLLCNHIDQLLAQPLALSGLLALLL